MSVRNTSGRTVKCEVALAVDADFADLFEVKDGRAGPVLDVTRSVQRRGFGPGARPGTWRSHPAAQRASDRQAQWGSDGARWQMEMDPHGAWSVRLQAFPSVSGSIPAARAGPARLPAALRAGSGSGGGAGRASGRSDSDWRPCCSARSRIRLAADLRSGAPGSPWSPPAHPGSWRCSGGTRCWRPGCSCHCTRGWQSARCRHWPPTRAAPPTRRRRKQPGQILHELRFGPATTRELTGGAYYGSIDATPLFVMLLGEFANWTVGADSNGLDGPVRELLPAADAALDWIEQYGDTRRRRLPRVRAVERPTG